MIVLKPVDLLEGFCIGLAQSWQERFFLIRCVASSASLEVLEGSLHRIAFLLGKSPALRSIDHNTKNAEEALDPSVAVFEHADRVVKTAVVLRANLNRHHEPH